jgi:hypothetical protein
MTPVTDTSTRAAVRSAALERFTRLIAGADSATRTLAAWYGEPPTTRIHTREEAATLPKEAVLLGLPPTTTVQRRHITHRRRDGTVLCEARAVVWLDSPALPGPVVARLRTGPQPLGSCSARWACGGARSAPAGCGTTAGRWSTRTRTERCWGCRPRWRSRTSGWPWLRRPIWSPCCGDRTRPP